MTADSQWAVQTAVYNRLSTDTALTALLPASGGVYDHAPRGTAFPYVVLNETTCQPLDTQTDSGADLSLTIHGYSRTDGFEEIKAIMAAIYDSLHNASFVITGQTLVLCRLTGAQCQIENDGETRHSRQTFRIITEPTP